MARVDVAVVGAGAIGLACGAALARRGRDVLVLERSGVIGAGISSRNSEVIHAGIYYAHGSWKQRLCVAGRRMLYPYLAARAVAHDKCGKLIVAADPAELAGIEALHALAQRNGVENLRMLTGAQARTLEPELACEAALLSPETGIFDSHGYLRALRGEIEAAGGAIAFGAPLEAAEPEADGWSLSVGGAEPMRLHAGVLINAAGLHAQAVARRIIGLDPEHVPLPVLAKGSYFVCTARPVFRRLIYPAPVSGGLGIHVTLDLAGRMRFGPDVEWLGTDDPDAVDYQVDPARGEVFSAAVRRYWPGLPDHALQPDYAGCRPKLSAAGAPAADFRIDGPQFHGLAGLVNLFGIESPGLTASLAIAEEVASQLA